MTTWPAEPRAESTWTKPSDWCPHPDRWNATDSDSTELEVTRLVGAFIEALQPDLVIETGAAFGQTSQAIGHVLNEGKLITYEPDMQRAALTRMRCEGLPVVVLVHSSLDGEVGLPSLDNKSVGFAWLDSLFELRGRELDWMVDKIAPGGVVGIHDVAPHHPMWGLLRRGRHLDGWEMVRLRTPRGVLFLQRSSHVLIAG